MMNPKVAVILINYNGEADTLECLSSLVKNRYQNWAAVVVDNASSNQEAFFRALKKQYPDAVFIPSSVNLGFSGGNNLGIRYAQKNEFDAVLLMNNDTIVDESALCYLVECAQRHPDAGILTGKILNYYQREKIWYAGGTMDIERAEIRHLHAYEIDSGIRETKKISFATGCLMWIPLAVIRKVGLLDDSYFMYAEDADYCWRGRTAGYSIYYMSEAILYHKVSAASGGRNSKTAQYYRTRNELELVRRYASNKPVAYSYEFARLLKRNLNGQFTIKCTLQGIMDFYKRKTGIKLFLN